MSIPFDFQQLIAPFDKQEFISNYYEKKPLVIRRGDPQYYERLLSVKDIDTIIKTGIEQGNLQLTMSHAAKKILPADYMSGWSNDRVIVQTGINQNKVFERFVQDKATMIIHNTLRYNAALQDLVSSVDASFGCNSGVNVFITPSNAQCFQVHYDEHDLFIIQISGSKRWKLFESAVYLPLEPQNKRAVDFSGLALLEDICLEQGDLLYLPRGFVHEVTTTDQLSCHITLGLMNMSWIKRFADHLTQVALEDEPIFRKAYLGSANRSVEELQHIVLQLRKTLAQHLSVDAIQAYLDQQAIKTQKQDAISVPSLAAIAAAEVHPINVK
ncbi:JmjC domain-containing protein [Chitinophaga rhizophila]|uniref:Cupin domain-containing protein n=1 Tax=Chitinophaga rhizophila TaxID=2866212 RepID=A0ABS7GE95_9BACT|nr:cupin domain-containing protein [Chitinophaga rhizophila]MBW8685991.1 cupin domain-containing protein [Chitinophaga rhizophila]